MAIKKSFLCDEIGVQARVVASYRCQREANLEGICLFGGAPNAICLQADRLAEESPYIVDRIAGLQT
jgi:hypothetical protein